MQVYQIIDWDEHFENSRSREIDRCSFVSVPNKQHGMGFSRIVCEPDGSSIYGIWHMILGACSQQRAPRGGWLADDGQMNGRPWAPRDLSLKFRRPIAEIERALIFLSSEEVGWMRLTKSGYVLPTNCRPAADAVPTSCRPSALEQNRTEQKEGTHTHSLTQQHGAVDACSAEAKTQCVRVDLKKVLPDKRAGLNGTPHLELVAWLNGLYHRTEQHPWSYEEQHLSAEIARRPAVLNELKALERYRKSLREKRYFPQTLPSLLNKWTATLDRARGAERHPSMRGE